MSVEAWIWIVSIAAIAVVIIGDLIVQVRKPHEPTFKESAIQYVVYFGLALMFTLLVTEVWGSGFGGEYLAGYITEWSLSVDNLFVFLIIFTKFRVPRHLQSEALLVGIVLALHSCTAGLGHFQRGRRRQGSWWQDCRFDQEAVQNR